MAYKNNVVLEILATNQSQETFWKDKNAPSSIASSPTNSTLIGMMTLVLKNIFIFLIKLSTTLFLRMTNFTLSSDDIINLLLSDFVGQQDFEKFVDLHLVVLFLLCYLRILQTSPLHTRLHVRQFLH